MQEELNRLLHPGQTQQKSLSVDVECASAGSFTLQFSYIIYNAGWAPVYDIRADSKSGKIEIISKARVKQKTGEDWDSFWSAYLAESDADGKADIEQTLELLAVKHLGADYNIDHSPFQPPSRKFAGSGDIKMGEVI